MVNIYTFVLYIVFELNPAFKNILFLICHGKAFILCNLFMALKKIMLNIFKNYFYNNIF